MGCLSLCCSFPLPFIALQATGGKEFGSQGWIFSVMTAPDRCAGRWRGLAHPAHLHAEMVRFQKNSDPVRMQHGLQRVGDLLADPLLYGEALRKEPHQAGQLRDADDIFMSDIAHIRLAVKGESMVFTQSKERDRSFYDLADAAVRFAAALGVKDSQQLRVAVITFGRIKKRLDKSPRGIFGPGRVQIQSECRKDLGGVALELVELLLRNFAHLQIHCLAVCKIVRVVMDVHYDNRPFRSAAVNGPGSAIRARALST